MSDKNYNAYLQMLQQAIAQANQPSQYENQANTDYSNIRNFLTGNGGAPDFRDPKGHGIVTGMLPLDEYHKQRTQLLGSHKKTPGLDPLLAGRQNDLSLGQFDQDYGNAYQGQIGGLMGNEQALGNTLQNAYTTRNNLNVYGNQAALQAFANKPPSMWSQLLPGILQGAASAGVSALGNYFQNMGNVGNTGANLHYNTDMASPAHSGYGV